MEAVVLCVCGTIWTVNWTDRINMLDLSKVNKNLVLNPVPLRRETWMLID
jgi:hypothetical protein